MYGLLVCMDPNNKQSSNTNQGVVNQTTPPTPTASETAALNERIPTKGDSQIALDPMPPTDRTMSQPAIPMSNQSAPPPGMPPARVQEPVANPTQSKDNGGQPAAPTQPQQSTNEK